MGNIVIASLWCSRLCSIVSVREIAGQTGKVHGVTWRLEASEDETRDTRIAVDSTNALVRVGCLASDVLQSKTCEFWVYWSFLYKTINNERAMPACMGENETWTLNNNYCVCTLFFYQASVWHCVSGYFTSCATCFSNASLIIPFLHIASYRIVSVGFTDELKFCCVLSVDHSGRLEWHRVRSFRNRRRLLFEGT